MKPEVQGTYSDLLQAALDSVNWQEIAENFWEEYREDEEEAEEADEFNPDNGFPRDSRDLD